MFKVLEDPGGELCTEEARQQAGGQAQEAGHQAHQVIRNKNLMKKRPCASVQTRNCSETNAIQSSDLGQCINWKICLWVPPL